MRSRTIIALVITLSGIGTAAWIIVGNSTSNRNAVSAFLGESDSLPSTLLQYRSENQLATLSSVSGLASGENNLTQTLIATYLSEVARQNPTGVGDGAVIPGAETLALLIKNGVGSQTNSSIITWTDIRIGRDDSAAAQLAYIEAVDAALHRRFEKLGTNLKGALQAFTTTRDIEPFRRLGDASSQFLTDLLTLTAPPSLAELHLNFANLWNRKVVMYQAFAGWETDPLRAYAALQGIETLVSDDAVLQSLFITRHQALAS